MVDKHHVTAPSLPFSPPPHRLSLGQVRFGPPVPDQTDEDGAGPQSDQELGVGRQLINLGGSQFDAIPEPCPASGLQHEGLVGLERVFPEPTGGDGRLRPEARRFHHEPRLQVSAGDEKVFPEIGVCDREH